MVQGHAQNWDGKTIYSSPNYIVLHKELTSVYTVLGNW